MLGIWGTRRTRAVALMAAGMALVGMWLVSARPAKAAFTGTNGKIAFPSDGAPCPGSGNQNCRHIYVMNPDGSGLGDLTPTSPDGADAYPSWNEGSTKLVYVGDAGLNVVNADGSGRQVLSDTATSGLAHPSWAPNSVGKIAYDDGADLFTVNADGTAVTKLTDNYGTNNGVIDAEPAWQPTTGSVIAFASTGRTTGAGIYLMNVSNPGTVTKIWSDPNSYNASTQHIDWSPDGKKLVFADGGNGTIDVMNADGTNLQAITVPALDPFDESPSWSPDGNQITFIANGANTVDVWVMNADGSNQKDVTNFSSPGDVGWSGPAWGSSSNGGTPPPPSTTTSTGPATSTTTTVPASTTTSTTPPAPQSGGSASPGTALPGQPVTLCGSGFAPNAALTITGSDPQGSLGTATSDSSGKFCTRVTIPINATPGTDHIVVSGPDPNGGTHRVLIDVSVASGPSSQSPGQASTPVATPGQTITVTGGGFDPNQPVGVTASNPSVSLGTATSDASGNVQVQVTIPNSATPGPEDIAIVGPDPSGGTHKVVATLTVVAPASVAAQAIVATPSFTG